MRGEPSTGSTSRTSRTTARSPTGPCASPSTARRCATPSGRTRSTSCTRPSTTPACRPTSGACCSPATVRRRRTGCGRSAPAATSASAVATATSTPASETADSIEPGRAGRLHILEVQRLIRFMPKVVICVVPGWAAGGGHSLHVVCDLTLASAEHARFKQTDADVASFDGGFGSAYLARQVGQKFAREIFFLGREYSRRRLPPHGRGQRRRAPRRAGVDGTGVGGRGQRQEPDRAADAQVRLQPRSTTGSSASSCSPVRPPASPTAPTKRRKVATPSSRSARRTGPACPTTTERE